MRKIFAIMSTTFVITTATAFASPVQDFQQGSVSLEIGSTLDSKVTGKGAVSADVIGKSGFKAGITAGLNDHLAIQYKQGMFKSEDSTISIMHTYAKAAPQDLNLLYKVNPNLTFIAGYETTKISYGNFVSDASKSDFHFGFTATQKLADKATLFATLIGGKNSSLKELGVSYALSKDTTFNLSYAERKISDVDLQVPAFPGFPGMKGKEDYTMKGISCLFAFKLQ